MENYIVHFPFSIFHWSFFYGCFVYKHDRNIIADRIYQAAVGIETLQTRLFVIYLEFRLTLGTAEYFEKFGTYGHILFSELSS